MLKPCLDCHRLVRAAKRGRCPSCHRAEQRARDATRGTPAQRGYDGTYLRARRAVLAASDGVCAWCGRRPATTVDHLVPLALGGTNEPENLIPCCHQCNSSRGSSLTWRPDR